MTPLVSATDTLGQRVMDLQSDGADPLRIELLHRARRFKRSWIEMAEALTQLRVSRAYEGWGYADLYGYCNDELLIKKRTVDKLTGSYRAIERHAPQILDAANDDSPMPSIDAVDYFARAMGEHRDDAEPAGAARTVVDELQRAVF